jgi:hypothetical protein
MRTPRLLLLGLSWGLVCLLIIGLSTQIVDRKIAMIDQLPDTIKFNYEKYGILGIIGVIVLTIIILTNIKLYNINNIITLTRL